MSTIQSVTESTRQETPLRVDREKGIIYGVKVCGNESRNRRHYPEDVLEAAVGLYEGVSVYLDHGTESGEERPLDTHFGNLQNVRIENGELYADLHYLTRHEKAEAIAERAEKFPRNFGLSHDAAIDGVFENGIQKVIEIEEVHSVDLVTRPATNQGIFEQETKVKTVKRKYRRVLESLSVKKYPGKFRVLEQMELDGDPMLDVPVEIPVTEEGGEADSGAAIKAGFRTMILAILDDASIDDATTMKKIKELLKQKEKLTSDSSDSATEEEDEEDEEATESEEDDDEILESEEDDEEAKESEGEVDKKKTPAQESLRRENQRLKKELARTKKDRVIESVLRKHKIPSTERIRESLRPFKSAAQMSAYLDGDDLSGVSSGVLESGGHAIESALADDMTTYKPAKDSKEFANRYRY